MNNNPGKPEPREWWLCDNGVLAVVKGGTEVKRRLVAYPCKQYIPGSGIERFAIPNQIHVREVIE